MGISVPSRAANLRFRFIDGLVALQVIIGLEPVHGEIAFGSRDVERCESKDDRRSKCLLGTKPGKYEQGCQYRFCNTDAARDRYKAREQIRSDCCDQCSDEWERSADRLEDEPERESKDHPRRDVGADKPQRPPGIPQEISQQPPRVLQRRNDGAAQALDSQNDHDRSRDEESDNREDEPPSDITRFKVETHVGRDQCSNQDASFDNETGETVEDTLRKRH